jgi:hypothetical protein
LNALKKRLNKKIANPPEMKLTGRSKQKAGPAAGEGRKKEENRKKGRKKGKPSMVTISNTYEITQMAL